METKASFIVTGAFTLAVIAGVFGFIYWVQSGGSSADRSVYRVVFVGSVAGLHTGSAVQFDGVRVGEVTKLALDKHDPRKIETLIAVDRAVPLRADTTPDTRSRPDPCTLLPASTCDAVNDTVEVVLETSVVPVSGVVVLVVVVPVSVVAGVVVATAVLVVVVLEVSVP